MRGGRIHCLVLSYCKYKKREKDLFPQLFEVCTHRSRIKTEEKAKVVALATYFASGWYLKTGMIHPICHSVLIQFIPFFISSWCNSSYNLNRPQLAWHRNEYILSPKQQRQPLSSLLSLFFFYSMEEYMERPRGRKLINLTLIGSALCFRAHISLTPFFSRIVRS